MARTTFDEGLRQLQKAVDEMQKPQTRQHPHQRVTLRSPVELIHRGRSLEQIRDDMIKERREEARYKKRPSLLKTVSVLALVAFFLSWGVGFLVLSGKSGAKYESTPTEAVEQYKVGG